jgi:ATP-binding cassette, subfamily C, bacterial
MLKGPALEKTPTILQMDNAECGAVTLAIILAYFGRFTAIAELREACDVTRDGSKAINIIKAARQYGLDAHGMQVNLENVVKLPPPFIAYWEFNHFLVIEGFAEDTVYLNDPANGRRSISMTEFSRSFTGIVLFMHPGPDFQPGGIAEPPIWQLLWQRLSGSRWSFAYIIFTAAMLAAPLIALAGFAKIFLDNILLDGQQDWLPILLLSMVITAILMAILAWLKRYYLVRLYMKLKITGVAQFFWRLLHLPLNFFQQRATGDIVDRVEAHGYVAEVLADKITNNIAGMFMMGIIALAMFLLSWPLALINLVMTLLNFLLLWIVSRRNSELGRGFAQAEGKLSAIEINGVQIIETLKANAVESQFFNQWASAHAQKVMNEQHIENNEGLLKILPVLSQGLNMVALLAVGAWLILHDQLSPGGLIAMQILLFSFNRPLLEFLGIGDYLYKLKGEVARLVDVEQQALSSVLDITLTTPPLPKVTAGPMLEFRQVTFGYSKLEPPVFAGISLRVNPGERIAVVGPTGGGKSSLAKLICGLYAPWEGEILVQGVPLAQISRPHLAEFAGLVDQQIFLFAATLRDNLTLWNPQVSDANIYRALNIAGIADLVKERGGLDCWVEERGRNFSGGQVQRLEIARALIANPQLLILDEATAALDPLIEQQIYENLTQQHCTLVIIAHRLSAVRDCDQIIVLDEGKIVQQGRHEFLIKDSGLYKELVSLEIQ